MYRDGIEQMAPWSCAIEQRWTGCGNVLQRCIECSDEIKKFLDEQNQIHEELSDLEWIARLMFFADFTQHLNNLNIKLQGDNEIITCMFDMIQAFLLEKLNLKVLEWLNLDAFKMQLVDFQSSTIWKEKSVILRNELEKIQRDRTIGKLVVNIGDKILKVWNEIPKDYSTLKK
ncbi:zinc finger MYM-type protein 6-like [Sipha flava]|uniref:Zinc finger MYM-type protein 6-like n=1 Tax=Sipha flava TaxID=143950 RepID=A0A8B8GQK6_9HEMI|nr:zinc finger MYM-type protein 6-like [Sipha flava]